MQDQIRTACNDVDGVDLQQLHPVDGSDQVMLAGASARRVQQALCGEMQGPRLAFADPVRGERTHHANRAGSNAVMSIDEARRDARSATISAVPADMVMPSMP